MSRSSVYAALGGTAGAERALQSSARVGCDLLMAEDERDSDDALLARVARGDAAAHRRLFDRHRARVTYFLRRRLSDRCLCEEVVSDVFFEVWRGAAAYRGESTVQSWIFGIAYFKTLGARRAQHQRGRNKCVPVADGAAEPVAEHGTEASVAARDVMRRLMRALRLLPEGQRDVVTLAFLEEQSYEEIARSLGISQANVKMRVHRARARLRPLLCDT